MRIYCPNPLCMDKRGNRTVLMEVVADCCIMRHGGRESVAREMVSIRCEKCGQIWGKEKEKAARH